LPLAPETDILPLSVGVANRPPSPDIRPPQLFVLMKAPFRIGTRRSPLATWQAEHVLAGLAAKGLAAELVFISTEGDRVLDTPLPLMGGKGVFTKALDDALLAGEIDLAVHSLKDVPTVAVPGLQTAAILPRADYRDALVARDGLAFLTDGQAHTLATGSHRRRAQWLHRYPHHRITDLRGNVNTRLAKLEASNWGGAVFAAAGLQRLELQGRISQYLDWMLPAPGQGAVAVATRLDDATTTKAATLLHHSETAACVLAERFVLNQLEGGCAAPLGALARVKGPQATLEVCLLSLDGTQRLATRQTGPADALPTLAERAVEHLLAQGAQDLLALIEAQSAELHGQ